ncbi:tetraspanin [Caerostris extrusa]|uniref:Tetraspanin n=1 Tax=Caerostris extrusa TaxID=172846 RepID=A0AAV4UXB9_CAEEX|nr:tetraspanin [Caerostris extrusa]
MTTANDNGRADIEMSERSSPPQTDKDSTENNRDASHASNDTPPPPLPKRDHRPAADSDRIAPEYAQVNKRKKLVSFPPRPDFVFKPERAGDRMTCLKNCLVVVNLLIWLLGAIVTAIGIWIKVDKDFFKIQSQLDLSQFKTSSTVLIVVGVVIMVVGFLGCWGAMASKIWMLVIFIIIVIIIILMEIAAIALVWSAVVNKNMQEEVKLKSKSAMHHMMDDETKRQFIEMLQRKLQCCGVDGVKDYSMDPANPMPVPPSCINTDTSKPYERGCYDAIVEFLKNKAAIIGGVALAVLLLQIGVLVFTTCLICSIKNAATNVIF